MANYRNMNQDYARRQNCGCNTAPVSRPVQIPVEPCCTHKDDVLDGMPIAMAYVPWQTWQCLFEPAKGFHCGTIFEELNKPFRGIGGCNR